MARSGPEIQEALRALVAKWQQYAGSEKGEAQTFLIEGERDYHPFDYLDESPP